MDEIERKNDGWDLSRLYHDIEDPRIKEDMKCLEEKAAHFLVKYQGKLREMSAKEISNAMLEFESILIIEKRLKSFSYLNFITQTTNQQASLFLKNIDETCIRIDNALLFFNIELSLLEECFIQYLKINPILDNYIHYLEQIRSLMPYQLTENEERILVEISLSGINSWENLFDKILSQMKYGENGKSEKESFSDLFHFDRNVRIKSSKDITTGLWNQSVVFTHILNAVITDKMIKDKIRKYPTWISSINLLNEVDDKILDTLVYSVKSRYDILQRYYRLKKKLLGYNCLFDYDRYAPLSVSSSTIIQWSDSKEIVLKAFECFSPIMGDIVRQFFDNKWIHASVVPGKYSGSFSYPTIPEANPYIMINYLGSKSDLRLLSHELGHGIHQFLTNKHQNYLNNDIFMVMSESVSSFAEIIVFQWLLNQAKNKNEKLSLLCCMIEEMFSSIFRQVALFCFENEIHKERRENGELSTEKINHLWLESQKEMYGDSVILTDNYSIWWSCVPHFFKYVGYVYSYAFGGLLALYLYNRYKKEGESFVSQYIDILKLGGKESPMMLFKKMGVSLYNPNFWLECLIIIENIVKEIENLVEDVCAKG